MLQNEIIEIEVVYTLEKAQRRVFLDLPFGSIIKDAIKLVGLKLQENEAVGVFGEIKTINEVVRQGDRVEIYRPLMLDPKLKRVAKVDKTNLPRRCQ